MCIRDSYRSDIDGEYEEEEYNWEDDYNQYRGNRITGVDENDNDEVSDRAESEVSDDKTVEECEEEGQEEDKEVIEIDDVAEEKEEDIDEEMERRYRPRRREGLRPRKPPTNMTDGYKLLNMEGRNEHLILPN